MPRADKEAGTEFGLILALFMIASTLAAGPVTVAVWDFDNNTVIGPGDHDNLREVLSTTLMESLGKQRGVRLVERSQFHRILDEQKLGSSELVEEEDRLRLGRMVGARMMVFGCYMVVGKEIRIDVRVVDVETSVTKAVESVTFESTRSNAPDLPMQQLAERLKASLGER